MAYATGSSWAHNGANDDARGVRRLPPEIPAADEPQRLARLYALAVLDTGAEPVFDAIARMAGEICGTPAAALGLVDDRRTWFKASIGCASVAEMPRGTSFCSHTIAGVGLFEVPDAAGDPRFAGNPLAAGKAGIRFYAGVPLVLSCGTRVGTLCVMDRQPRRLDPVHAGLLHALARVAAEALAARPVPAAAVPAQAITERLQQRLAEGERFVHQITDSLPVRISYLDRELRYRFVNVTHCQRFGRSREEIIGHTRAEMSGRPDRVIDGHAAAALGGRPQRFEYDENGADGPRRIEVQMVPDVAEDGTVRGFYATGIDITERAAAASALRELTAIFDNTTDYVVQADGRGRITYMNPAVRWATGLGAEEPVAHRNFSEFITPETRALFESTINTAVARRGIWVGDTTVVVEGPRIVPVSHMVLAHRDAQGRIARYSSVMRDISAQAQAREQLQRQTAALRSVIEAIPAIVAVIGSDQRYRFVNRAYERWTGSARDGIVGRTMREALGPSQYERSRERIERVLRGESLSFEKEYPGRHSGSHLSISYVPLWLEDGTVDGFVSMSQDITRHRQEEVRLLQLSQRDALTGLLNRAGIEHALRHTANGGEGKDVALLYIDLDRFKPVNDRYGHAVGDRVLQIFAQRLLGLVRPADHVGRLGGDEFAIVLCGVHQITHASKVAEKVVEATDRLFEVESLRLSVGASVGVAFGLAGAGPKDLADFLARGDAMLYRAKEAGRGRHVEEAS
jgi:diguanylate cyclase (GGDEF)-like protein/PAS domain S-box-containing protein